MFEELKVEIAEYDMGPIWVDMDFVDPDSGAVLANAGEDIPEENLDRVLYLVMEDDRSRYTIIDNGVFWATGHVEKGE